jgi:GNAT superfamily N-acetyltransferase
MVGGLRLERLTGPDLQSRLADLARLRIAVFRDFPYLYDGDPDYERDYLETYVRSPDSALIVAFDGDSVVGAATALPLVDETDEVIEPFRRQRYDVERIFYFGESVLLQPYRGRGVGVAFFEEREGWARRLGRFHLACFCAVYRPADHPQRPKGYVSLDAFWRRRGFQLLTDMESTFAWKEVDETTASAKRMLYWSKILTP